MNDSRTLSRRNFLQRVGKMAAAASTAIPASALHAQAAASLAGSPFRIAVIDDEVDKDFGRACEVAAREFGMHWIELRELWGKNSVKLDAQEIAEARRILAKYNLRVTDIASPLFKVDFPGAPHSRFSEPVDFGSDFTAAQQDEVLERSIERAKQFGTDRVRCFDFWRLDDQTPYREAMNDKLRKAAERVAKDNLILLLENEGACNTATGAESAKLLQSVTNANFMLNWDPGNATAGGEKAFPDGYQLLPKDRIGHCHCKDVFTKGEDWAPMGGGIIDWAGQFRALKRDGFRYAVSLETHWRGAGSPEESSRQSWKGMKRLLQQAGAL